MSQNQIEQIELEIDEAKRLVRRAQMARRLADNPDFKELVLEGYFVQEAARLVPFLSAPNIDEPTREAVNRDALAIGGFKRYLQTAIMQGDSAQSALDHAEIELDELREMEDAANMVEDLGDAE